MANVLPEVQPVVTSMPDRGYELQTGGSARRSFIKNNNDTYFIHGVPGHTHNSSAMISVTAEYTRKRDITSTINTSWANEPLVLAATEYTDSKEPRDKDERYDRAIERGIGRIIMIPENTNHIIEEPVRSISEIRTIVSPKDQLSTLTYVSNVHGDGWVDPVTGVGSTFNRDDPVMVNFYSYEGVPRLEVGANGQGTMRQPVYVANPNVNTIRYAITSAGSYDPAGNNMWDGNVPFIWDEKGREYYSEPFTVYFEAYELKSIVVGTEVQSTGQGLAIARADFAVEFEGYNTSRAQGGYCVFSQQNALVVTKSTATTGQDLVSVIPVQVQYAAIGMFSLAYWYGPPAFRIPVGGKYAIPAPPRQQANNFPGTYDDQDSNRLVSCQPFFQILDNLTDLKYSSRAYDTCFQSRIAAMKAADFPVKCVAPGLPANDAGNSDALKATLWRFYVRPFGYGETKQTLVSSNLKSTRHGFSSFLKYGNSPYLGNNGMYAPTNPTDLPENRPYSKYTSDGIVPYPFIQPGLTASNGNLDVTVDWDDAEYTSGKNINDLVCMFPEEELHELRDGIGNLPAGGLWAGYTQQQRQNFYGGANYSMRVDKMGDGNHVEWVVTQPNHATPNLFRDLVNPGAPFTNANTGAVAGGSASHHQFVFTRLYRTFAQFKKDPSNDLGASIIAGAMSEFKEHQRNRVGAPGVYIVYDDGPGGHTMMTFPFRWLMNHRTNTVTDESFNSQFETSMSMMGNPTGTLQATLTDTGANNVAPGDWVIGDQGVKMVARNITLSGAANTGAYPYTTEAHPKYNAYVHNAIGNMFEIPAGVSGYTTTVTHLTLKDIYWELDEFTDESGAPTIVLCFNNYGTTFDLATTPMAYHLFQNTGVAAVYNRDQAGVGAAQNNQDLAALNVGAANGFNRVNMSIPFANFKRIDNNGADDILTQAKFGNFIAEVPATAPALALFVPGKTHVTQFHNQNYAGLRDASAERGKVYRADVKISQHLCSPVLNPDMRLSCIAPLNHASRHLPPEMRDFQLILKDVDFSFLKAISAPILGDLVLSEFNGGIQTVAAQESLLYLPNFIEFTTSVQADMTFTVDCMTGKGVPGYLCVFCRDSDGDLEQPLIKRLSLQNLTTMKKSDSVINTDVHELYHMTQRNVHPRSEYDSAAFNRRQTLLLTAEDIGIMGLEAKHYQRQKRVQIRVSGLCTNAGTVTVIFIYNNRGLFVKGRQQSVVHM